MQLSLFEIDPETGDVVTPDQPKQAHVRAFAQPITLLPCPFPDAAAAELAEKFRLKPQNYRRIGAF